jgi:hypothetical protein
LPFEGPRRHACVGAEPGARSLQAQEAEEVASVVDDREPPNAAASHPVPRRVEVGVRAHDSPCQPARLVRGCVGESRRAVRAFDDRPQLTASYDEQGVNVVVEQHGASSCLVALIERSEQPRPLRLADPRAVEVDDLTVGPRHPDLDVVGVVNGATRAYAADPPACLVKGRTPACDCALAASEAANRRPVENVDHFSSSVG